MKFLKIILLNLLLLTFCFGSSFEEDSSKLMTRSFNKKQVVLDELLNKYKDDARFETLLKYMLKGDLYYTKEDKRLVVLLKKVEYSYFTQDLLTGKNLEKKEKYDFKKIKINNKLRSVIKAALAQINLFSTNKDKRYSAAKNILSNLEKEDEVLINKALQIEKVVSVKELLLESKINLIALYSTNLEQRVEAVKKLGSYMSSRTFETLKNIENSLDEKILKDEAKKALGTIKHKKSFYGVIQELFFGLSLGSVLLLAAIGLAITFGVMKVINMAHGELIMIGAYTTYTIQQLMPNLIEYSVIIAIPVAFVVSGLVGVLIERLVIRHLYGRPLETLLATFGISLILQQLVRSIYSPLNQEVKTPSWMSGALEINSSLFLTYNRLYIIIFALIVFFGVLFVMKKTSLGLKVRAVSQNRTIARAMGIKSSYIDALTFGIGSGIAGIAGVALSQLTNVGPNLGQAYIVDSFMVVVFGGVGNLWGTLIAAFSLGEINKFMEPVAGAVLAKVIILVFIILFIQKRPRGLFPQKGRDAED
ncbi:urea ABC transporter permease subunit UrtB [Arcobacter sp. CECT 8986]|uniref:urea ABC transporter permease subunit UrtB n=1 Tax=Arcobacter sp. CECT 8986 TaxID=2044507 RepID=UPI001009B4C1|nr:urea ABC transporter permease subunit UrtB [Arcobacter sp. CECT 8986]RXJ98744.1 urea ABC transporter permease subunit UrtB [Arcobacter sp. CECT 8986]